MQSRPGCAKHVLEWCCVMKHPADRTRLCLLQEEKGRLFYCNGLAEEEEPGAAGSPLSLGHDFKDLPPPTNPWFSAPEVRMLG